MAKNFLRKFETKEIEKELEWRKHGKTSYPANTVILLGPPGVGKATQCSIIKETYGYCHIASGQLLRYHIDKGTQFGSRAKKYFGKGELVPDIIMNDIVKSELNQPECQKGVVFEGYPKNMKQAEFLDGALGSIGKKVDLIFKFGIEEEKLFERVEGRRVHAPSGRSYHIKFNPPMNEGKDDLTGETLYKRPEDKKEIAHKKFQSFSKNVDNILQFYSKRDITYDIDANPSIIYVWDQIQTHLI